MVRESGALEGLGIGEADMVQKYKWKNIIPVLLILLAFVLLNINTFTTWFRGDSELYYQGICENVENLKKGKISLANFGIAGHMCYGYSLFVFIGHFLIPYYGIGIRLTNLFMALATIFIFWKVIGVLFPKIEKWTGILITAAFAFSPLMLGIFSEVHSDFPVLCFFIWLVYCYITKRQVLCLVTGFLLCFSKETGPLYYASFFAGCFLYRCIKNENRNWFKKLGTEFSSLEWMLVVPLDLFLIAAAFAHGWANSAINPEVTSARINSFCFSPEYIWMKFREIFVLNFAWLLVIPLGLFIAAFLKGRLQKLSVNREWMAGLCVSAVVFLLFNFSYFTFTHYRYLQLCVFFYMVLTVFLLESSCQKVWIKRCVSLLMAAAFLVESFVTADPVTHFAFQNVQVGNGTIVSLDEVDMYPSAHEPEKKDKPGKLLDSIVYNREYLGFERAFEEAMEDIGYDESTLLFFPVLYEQDVVYTLLAYFGTHDSSKLRWDKKTNNLTKDKEGIRLNYTSLEKGVPDFVPAFSEVWYVKLYHQGEWYRESNLEYFDVLEERTYQSGKWKFVLEKVKYRG